MKTADRVLNYLSKEIDLSLPAKVIVGFSGGADSITLLHILHRLGYDCLAAHCNFHLRGAESDRDEHVAAEFANHLGIPFLVTHFDTEGEAKARGISIEMAARNLRYEWFEQLRQAHHADSIAVAHHQDDSIETMLLNLIRGTGIAGLTGIKPRNRYVVRPLLCLNRAEIEQYIAAHNLSFVTDSTNLEDSYTRNKIRHHLLPLLETFNPAIRSSLLQTADNLNEVANIYHAHIKKAEQEVFDPDRGAIDIAALKSLPSPEAVLFELLRNYGYNKDDIREILHSTENHSGKEFYSHDYRLVKDRDYLLLTKKPHGQPEEYPIHQEDTHISLPLNLDITYITNEQGTEIRKDPAYAFLDADRLSFPLTLRRWKSGDRFVPFGMQGSQKLSDYFNNNKFSIPQKENTWLLCSGDKIVWIVGHRIDNRYKITTQTKTICVIRLRQ